jgi:hypothetical protein
VRCADARVDNAVERREQAGRDRGHRMAATKTDERVTGQVRLGVLSG